MSGRGEAQSVCANKAEAAQSPARNAETVDLLLGVFDLITDSLIRVPGLVHNLSVTPLVHSRRSRAAGLLILSLETGRQGPLTNRTMFSVGVHGVTNWVLRLKGITAERESLKKARPVLFLLRNGAGNGQRSYYHKKRGRCRRGLCLLDTSTLGLPAGCALQLRQLPLVGGPLACRSLFSWPTREESLLPLPIAIDIGIGIVLFEPSGAVHLAIDEQGVRWRSRSRFRCPRHAYPRTGPSAPPASHRFFPLPYYPLPVTYYLLPILLLISRSHTAEATMRLRSSSRTTLGWWPARWVSSSWHQIMTIRRSPTVPL